MRSDLVSEFLIFQKWRDSASLIKFRLTTASLSLQAWASVVRADSEEIALDLKDGVGYFSFTPSKCSMRYQDPREADEDVKMDVESNVVCALSIAVSEGVDLWLYEWRDDAS